VTALSLSPQTRGPVGVQNGRRFPWGHCGPRPCRWKVLILIPPSSLPGLVVCPLQGHGCHHALAPSPSPGLQGLPVLAASSGFASPQPGPRRQTGARRGAGSRGVKCSQTGWSWVQSEPPCGGEHREDGACLSCTVAVWLLLPAAGW